MTRLLALSLLAFLPLHSLAQGARLVPAIGAMRLGDYVQAIDTLKPLAAGGDTEAQYLLGLAYESAPQPDLASCLEWYKRAAGQGHPGAQNNLGTLYYDGRGVPRDYAEAARLYGAAAAKDHPEALYNLALMHGMGVGMPRDERTMVRLLSRAADLGLANAQAQLGISYQRGLGVTRDLEKSQALLLQAARGGHKGAMRELASVYEMGLGVPSDDAEAKRWRERAQ